MTRGKYKNNIKNNQGNMVTLEPSYPTIAYSNTAEVQANFFKCNIMKVIKSTKDYLQNAFIET